MLSRMQFLLAIFILVSFHTYGQIISGRVVDAETGTPLSFATIAIEGQSKGTIADLDGVFTLNAEVGANILISHVGYKEKKIPVASVSSNRLVKLEKSITELNEFIFYARENPAIGIARKVMEHRENHDPEELSSFKYHSYNKFVMTLEDAINVDSVLQVFDSVDSLSMTEEDSAMVRLDSLLDHQHMFMSESVTEKKYLKPNRHSEKLIGIKYFWF